VRSVFTIRRAVTMVALVATWCALWGSASAANVLSGIAVAAVALLFGSSSAVGRGIRIIPMLHLIWLVFVDMVGSTVTVVREVLTPTDYTNEAIIAIDLPPGGEHHLLLLFVVITVTPGTAVVAAESNASKLYLHVLHADRRDAVEAHVRQLADVASRALPQGDAS
jgi:multicomponent Na+:H+ antiporter subunit E